MPRLRDKAFGGKRFAIFILAQVVAFPAAARMLVEWIGAERHGIAHPCAEQIAERNLERFADEIEAGGLDRGIGARRGVERVFAWHQHGLGHARRRCRHW